MSHLCHVYVRLIFGELTFSDTSTSKLVKKVVVKLDWVPSKSFDRCVILFTGSFPNVNDTKVCTRVCNSQT